MVKKTGRGSRIARVPWRHPIFRFVVLLLILLGLFEIVLTTDFVKEKFVPSYLRQWARVSGEVMAIFGEDVTVSGSAVSSPCYEVNIKKGCDAIQPSILLIAAVLASPVVLWTKVPGLILGLLFLMGMNLIRIISLFYIGVHYPKAFDIMHHDVWQVTFIFLAILAWGLWAVWAANKTASVGHAAT